MKKLNLLCIFLISFQQQIISGPVVSKFIGESLRIIVDYVEQQKIERQQNLLFHAILINDKQLIQFLIDQNDQKLLNTRDENGDTSLHYAAEQRSVSTVDLLLLSGANPLIVNNNKERPFHIAVKSMQSNKIMQKLSPDFKNKKQIRRNQKQ